MAESEGAELQIMYGVDGERVLTEQVLEHLSGYENSRPVRIGNAAYEQKQHDVWGAVVASVALYTGSRHRVDDRLWRIVQTQVRHALEHWREPRPGPLGGALGAAALHLVEGRVLDGGRRRRPDRRRAW